MNDYRFPENKLTKICFPLFLLALQLVARSTMFTSTIIGFNLSQTIMIGLVLLTGLVFLVYNRRNLKQILLDRRMLAFAAAALVVLGPMVIKQDWQVMYFTILLCWFFSIFLTYFTTVSELAFWYVGIMVVLGIWSVAGQLLLKPMANAGVIPAVRFDSPGGWHMLNFGLAFACDKNIHMDDALRSFGIFREPGLYQIFLFVAIHLNNYWVNWKKQWQMWAVNGVLFVSLLLTFATGGVLALGLYIVFLFFDKGLYRNKYLRLLAVLAVAAGAVLLAVALARGGTWAYELVGMVEKIYNRTYSLTDRLDAIVSDTTFFFSSPLYGAGLSEVMYSVPNNTATSPILFAVFGIVGGCVHVLSWVAFAWKKERHWIMNLILLVILFVPFNTQNVIPDMFFWLFPMMALTQWCLPRLDFRNRKQKTD